MSKRPMFVALLCASLGLFSSAALGAVISVGPYTPSSTMPFVVPVMVDGAVALDTFTFDLAYDPANYAINTACDPFGGDPFCDFVTGPVTIGPFFGAAATFPPLFNPGFILLDGLANQIGRLIAVNGAWQDPGPGPSGSGILAYIEFVAVAGGSTTTPIVVVGNSVPEPSPLLLVCGALALLAWPGLRRRRR